MQTQPLARIDRNRLKLAKKRGASFVHKFAPSGYDTEVALALDESASVPATPSISRAKSRTDTPPTLYGRWWHSLFQQMSWRSGIEPANAIFLESLTSSPDKGRSTAEWKMATEKLFCHPVLTCFLSGNGTRIQAEFPFVWSIDSHSCVEGVIDLLAIDAIGSKCLLLDWKTNRIAKGEEENLRDAIDRRLPLIGRPSVRSRSSRSKRLCILHLLAVFYLTIRRN